jgi:hypothetical protein
MQNGIKFPKRIFFTGVPGSRWSGIAQTIESLDGFNISDRTTNREYSHNGFSGHKGVYFGQLMEFDAILDAEYIDQAWSDSNGTKIIKSHHWAYMLDEIKIQFPNDWIMLVYRPDLSSHSWWHEAGGFNIKYPNYEWYKNSSTMLGEIIKQNACILEFAQKYDLTWNYFTTSWIQSNFKQTIEVKNKCLDILVTLLK